MEKRNVYAAKAKRIIVVLLVLAVFVIASMIAAYSSQSPISTHPLIDAEVSPLKVRPGDTMLITASCVDSAGIETVTADMGGIETVQLSLISGTIYNGTWQATWLVHDTEVRDYNTTVTATNVFGECSSVNIGWSDPATEGMGAYGEGTVTTPRYRLCYVGTGWGSEQSANDVGGVTNMVVLRAAPTRNEKILGVLDKSGHINVQVWSGSSWGNGLEVTTAIGANYIYRGFDIAYEDSSGDALIVYQNNTDDPLYRVWNGTGWSDAVTLDLPTAGIPVWIRLKSKPGSDEIIVATLDLGEDVTAAVWNGSAWGNNISLETAAESSEYNGIAIAYESTSGDAMVAWSDGALKSGGPQYRLWSGSAWGVEATAPETGDEPLYLELGSDPDPSSDKIVMGAIDAGRDVNVNVWDGAAWGTNEEVTAGAEISVSKPADVEFESTSSEAIVAYSENGDPVLHYNTWSAGTWSAQLDGPNFGSDIQTCDLCSCPYSDDIMLGAGTDDSNLRTARWSGSAWGTVDIIETGVSSTYAMFMFAPDRCFTISDVDAGGPYSVGDTISVTWDLTGSASDTENYINVQYWDVTTGTQFNLTSNATSATSSTSRALTSSEVGHTIAVYVYSTSSSGGDRSTAITQGDTWPYSIANAVTSWMSYNNSARTSAYQDDDFTTGEDYVYMNGGGFNTTGTYKVAYYDGGTDHDGADGNKLETDIFTNDPDGILNESQCQLTAYPASSHGTWHAVVYYTTGTMPDSYDLVDKVSAAYACEDSFLVHQEAIFPAPAVQTPSTYDNITMAAKTVFARNEGVTVRVNVTDGNGRDDISKVLIKILNTTSVVKVDNVTMTNITEITKGYTYEYNYTIPSNADLGTWTINVYANDTLNAWDSNTTTFDVYRWSNVTWVSPPDESSYEVGETITLTCLVRDANTSSGIENYPVRFYNKTDSTVTYIGLNYTNSSGYAVMDWDTAGVTAGWYYPKGNITDNSTMSYTVTADNEANTSVELSYVTTLEIKNQTNVTAIGSINFSGVSGATVINPHNNVDGSGSPQDITSKTPVVTIYNPSSSTNYKIWLKVTDGTGWDDIISDEKFNVTADGASPGGASGWTTLTPWGGYNDSGVTVAAGTHKDLYLAFSLKGSGTGSSTLSVLGEAV